MIKLALFIRRFLVASAQFTLSIFKIIFLSKWNVKVPERKGTKVAVLANGPSLEKALSIIEEEGGLENIMVTNYFCRSELYDKLKPNYYVVCDPIYTKLTDEYPDVKKFYTDLYGKTNWDLTFFVPFSYLRKVRDVINELNLSNPHIQLMGYNVVNFNGDNWFNHLFFKRKLGMPRPTTVAVPAMMLCIQMGYTKIQIAGIDLNQHRDLVVDQSNRLLIKTSHFYSNEETLTPFYKNKKEDLTFSSSEIFLIFHRFFYSFDIIAKFARNQGIEIVNYSKESFLDQFKKA